MNSNELKEANEALALYSFDLPDELIARYPARRRDQSRLMVVDRAKGTISHHRFHQLPDFLRQNDLLIMNDSKVFKARINARRPSGGNVELLLVRRISDSQTGSGEQEWLAMIRPASRIRPGERLQIEPKGEIVAVEPSGEGRWRVAFSSEPAAKQIMSHSGHVPLPPYMRRGDEPTDLRRYQTVYARPDAVGSIAAPTAGFHFTRSLLARIDQLGIARSTVTLHVGPGTFIPMHTDSVAEHVMEAELAELSEQTARAILDTRRRQGRVIAVGTTTVRTLEAAVGSREIPRPYQGEVTLFIKPGHQFKYVDSLITNFHLPKSTLLVLVSTFAGRELIQSAYQTAIREKYRFYSYGDAMLIL